jgi:transcriptional antiterminator NusG
MSKQWYIVHTYSGFEKKVKESLEGRVAAFGLQEKIGQMIIPTESVVEVRGGKKVISPRMCYPGYLLVEMDMDDYTWHVVRSTPKVILNRATTTAEKPKPKLSFDRNEQVRIVDGPFANFNGTVEEIDPDHSRLKVSVTIFGRATPVELDFASVEKIA